MKKYEVRCQGGECGATLGSLELPDHQPLTDQASGYYCQDCGKKLSANLGSREAVPSGLPPERRAAFEAFRARMGDKTSVAPQDLDELVALLFRK